jgi:hypothetical protein
MQHPIAAVRLYVRALERESVIEDAIIAAIPVEEFLASLDGVLGVKVKAAVAVDPEFQYLKAELARQLRLGPDDWNPLDEFLPDDLEFESADDPRLAKLKQAVELSRWMSDAHLAYMFRRGPALRVEAC